MIGNPCSLSDPLGLEGFDPQIEAWLTNPKDYDAQGNLKPTQLEGEELAVVNSFAHLMETANKTELTVVSVALGGSGAIEGMKDSQRRQR